MRAFVSERFCGIGETFGPAAAPAAPVRRDQTAASADQHQQQHDCYHIVHGAHQGAVGEHQEISGNCQPKKIINRGELS